MIMDMITITIHGQRIGGATQVSQTLLLSETDPMTPQGEGEFWFETVRRLRWEFFLETEKSRRNTEREKAEQK